MAATPALLVADASGQVRQLTDSEGLSFSGPVEIKALSLAGDIDGNGYTLKNTKIDSSSVQFDLIPNLNVKNLEVARLTISGEVAEDAAAAGINALGISDNGAIRQLTGLTIREVPSALVKGGRSSAELSVASIDTNHLAAASLSLKGLFTPSSSVTARGNILGLDADTNQVVIISSPLVTGLDVASGGHVRISSAGSLYIEDL